MIRPLLLLWVCLLHAAPLHAQTLRILHIDVESADAALIVMPNGKILLVDSGKDGQGARIKKVMDSVGATKIDVFVNLPNQT